MKVVSDRAVAISGSFPEIGELTVDHDSGEAVCERVKIVDPKELKKEEIPRQRE